MSDDTCNQIRAWTPLSCGKPAACIRVIMTTTASVLQHRACLETTHPLCPVPGNTGLHTPRKWICVAQQSRALSSTTTLRHGSKLVLNSELVCEGASTPISGHYQHTRCGLHSRQALFVAAMKRFLRAGGGSATNQQQTSNMHQLTFRARTSHGTTTQPHGTAPVITNPQLLPSSRDLGAPHRPTPAAVHTCLGHHPRCP